MPHTNSKQRSALRSRKNDPSSQPPGKRAARPPLAVYDESARYQYLTGFSARKKAGKEAAQKRALERAREEKLDFRRQLRETRLAKVKETITEQAEWYGIDAFSSVDKTVSEITQTETLVHDDENDVKEKMTTTVTIEPFEVDHSVLLEDKPQLKPARNKTPFRSTEVHSARPISRPSSSSSLKKPKKKITKIPYESKATRTIERAKKQRKRESKAKGKIKDTRRTGHFKRG